MKRVIFTATLSVIMSSPVLAQRPVSARPQAPRVGASSAGKAEQYAITAKGCIDKRRLAVSKSEAEKLPIEGIRATEFTLNGPSDVLRLLREHSGHDDELAGIVSVPAPRRPVVPSVDAKKLEPLSVGIGGREFYGFRVAATLRNDAVWYDVNARSARHFLLLGAVMVVLEFVLPRSLSNEMRGTFAVVGLAAVTIVNWRHANRLARELGI